jgi:hypothetical protein
MIVRPLAGLLLFLRFGAAAYAQAPPATPRTAGKAGAMTARATGTFDVKLTPLPSDDKSGSAVGRMSIDKQYHGDLEGTGRGAMLTAMTAVEGSAGYVAIERVEGKLEGRSGAFVLQHSGIMTRGAPTLTITVVPDSGTGALAGIAGRLSIEIAGGKHSYVLEYTLPAGP